MPHKPDLSVGEPGPAARARPSGTGRAGNRCSASGSRPKLCGLQAREKVLRGPQSSGPFSLCPLEPCVDPDPRLRLQEPPALHPLSLLWARGCSPPGWPPLQPAYYAPHVASCDNGRQQPDQVCTGHLMARAEPPGGHRVNGTSRGCWEGDSEDKTESEAREKQGGKQKAGAGRGPGRRRRRLTPRARSCACVCTRRGAERRAGPCPSRSRAREPRGRQRRPRTRDPGGERPADLPWGGAAPTTCVLRGGGYGVRGRTDGQTDARPGARPRAAYLR